MNKFTGRISEKQEIEILKESERKIVYEIVNDARAPITKYAKNLHISKDTVQYALNKFQKTNIITQTAPIVDLNRLGYSTFQVFFVTNDSNKEKKEAFLKHLENHPHTKSLTEYSDRWEIEWVLVARTVQEFDDIVTKEITQFSDIIIEKIKLLVIKGYKSTTVASRAIAEFKNSKEYEIDEIDKKIIKQLHDDGRKSSYNIANELKLSPNAVRYRIKNLLQTNIIRQFTATINLNALGYHLYTVGIVLKSLDEKQEAKLVEFIRTKRFIIRAVKVLGHWDLILTIISDSINHFHETVKQVEDEFSDIILTYESMIAYEERLFKYVPDVVLKSV